MSLRLTLAPALLLALAIGCSEDQPPASSTEGTAIAPSLSSSVVAAPKPAPGAAASTIQAPPKDARYTIYCLGVSGPDHVQRADQIKLLWQQATGRRDWYVLHQEEQSIVYFGYYRSIYDTKDSDTARALADRKMLQNLKDTVGDQPFAQAMLLPLDAPDPDAPPQWNLVNAKGAWTVEIAVYKGPGRKAAAVKSVEEARKDGIEAYYYHGPSASSVCIGTWPAEAVTQQMQNEIQNTDPSKTLMVIPAQLAAQMPDATVDKDGNPIQIIHDGAQINDPTLVAMMQKYPVHALNGNDDIIMVNGKPQAVHSAVVAIPHSDDSASGAPVPNGPPTVDLLGGDKRQQLARRRSAAIDGTVMAYHTDSFHA